MVLLKIVGVSAAMLFVYELGRVAEFLRVQEAGETHKPYKGPCSNDFYLVIKGYLKPEVEQDESKE